MRRLGRILWNAATAMSLLLCVATVALWVRSYQKCDEVWWSIANPRLVLAASGYRGGLVAGSYKPVATPDPLQPSGAVWNQGKAMSFTEVFHSRGTWFNRFGFTLEYARNNLYESRFFACPYWSILLPTALLPCARLVGWRRRARRLRMRPNLCRHCGYDVRATPDRCPECGAIPTQATP